MSAMRYVGGGSFYIGIPARDLTAEEAERHRDVLEGSPLYEPVDGESGDGGSADETDGGQQPAGGETQADEESEGE